MKQQEEIEYRKRKQNKSQNAWNLGLFWAPEGLRKPTETQAKKGEVSSVPK